MIACQICEEALRDYEQPQIGDPIACFDCLDNYGLPMLLGLLDVERYITTEKVELPKLI